MILELVLLELKSLAISSIRLVVGDSLVLSCICFAPVILSQGYPIIIY